MGNAYCHIFAFVEEFIIPLVTQEALKDAYGDEVRLRSLLRFAEEELKHQELFRRIEMAIGAKMPGGYVQVADPTDIARSVLAKCSWAVLALTCHVELFTQVHYRESIERDEELSDLALRHTGPVLPHDPQLDPGQRIACLAGPPSGRTSGPFTS